MEEVQKYWLILKRRKIPAAIAFGLVVILSIIFTALAKPVYEANGVLLLKRKSNASSIGDLADKLPQLESLSTQSSPVNTEMEVIRSIPIIQSTIDDLKLKDPNGKGISYVDFSKILKVKNTIKTDIIEVSYRNSNPEVAANVINKLFEIYIKGDIKNNRLEAQAAREFIELQLPKVEKVTREAEYALRQFKDANQVIDLGAEANAAVQRIGEISRQLTAAESDLSGLTTQSINLQKSLGMTSDMAFLWGSPSIQQTLGELQQVEQKIATEKSRFRDQNPVIIDLNLKKASLKNLLQQRAGVEMVDRLQERSQTLQTALPQQELINSFVKLETERLGLMTKIDTLNKAKDTFVQRTKILPQLEQQERELERRLKVAQSTYESLLSRLQAIRVTENQTIGNVRVVSPGLTIEKPVFPQKGLIIILGVVLGLLLAGAVVTILEALDRSIKTIDEIRDLSIYPIMGIIPDFNNSNSATRKNRKGLPGSELITVNSQLIVRDAPRSPITESFRILQTNLQFSNSDNSLKVIVVTSSVPQEGKSTTAANLALTIAELGKKVLIIDADMRKPSQHKVWQIDNKVGLSNVLTNQTTWTEAKQSLGENIDIVSSGPIPPNPVTLIKSKGMAELVEKVSKEYDLVILDSPPVTVAADASILGKIGNGILLVVRPEVADSGSFSYTKRVLEQSEQNVFGMVINGVTPENNSYSYNYYYYMSSYYGEESKAMVEK